MSDLVAKVLKCKENRHTGPKKVIMNTGTTSWIECQNCRETYAISNKPIDTNKYYLNFHRRNDYK